MPTFLIPTLLLLVGQTELVEDAPDEAVAPRRWLQELLTGADEQRRESRLHIQGWTEASFTASSVSGNQLPLGFNYLGNEFLLQQNWLRLERPVDTTSNESTFGFLIDTILPGSDYRFTVARGLWDQQLTANNGAPARYGIDPVQFYGEAYFPEIGRGLELKVGRFVSPYGIESIAATTTPLASRSYTFLYDPYTHTGALATLQVSDSVTIQHGLVTGCDIFLGPAATPTYLGTVKWSPAGGPDSVQVSTILSDGRYDVAEQFNHPQVFDLVWTHQFRDDLTYSLDALYGFQTNVPTAGFANWFGIVNYLTRVWTPRLSSTSRLEFFNDTEGARTGSEGLYTAVTSGLAWRPISNLTLRPELRFDHNAESRPFQGKANLYTVTLDVILHW